ncbi:MAG TPA: hypothetical protein VH207_14035 [Chthoniobacterales bacterium]|jgi:hypothetical protein|nr:hypothetical protein [Chthoniobacterales bacterium]
MFPLSGKNFPTDAEALRAALEESLRRVVRPAGPMVTVEEKSYPELAAIRVSLDGANAGEGPPPRPAPPVGPVEPWLRVADFEISGQPILVKRARVNLSCKARAVQLGQGRDRDGQPLLLLQDAAEGKIEVGIALADLETLVLAGAKAEAARQGVTVEEVRIELGARGERALDVVVHLRAKKLFLRAAVRISGSVTIDKRLNARFSGLGCGGEGTLGTLACGFIAPHLQRFNERDFSLLALPLGEVTLRDVRVATGQELRVTADFGRA